MGTNYYAIAQYKLLFDEDSTSLLANMHKTKDEDAIIHIGKSSAGWRFLFQDSKYFHNYKEFLNFINRYVVTHRYRIYDEYGDEQSAQALLELIQHKQKIYDSDENFDNGIRNESGYRFCDNTFS